MRIPLLIGAGVAAAAYSPAARRWYLTWGATQEEANGPLPGIKERAERIAPATDPLPVS